MYMATQNVILYRICEASDRQLCGPPGEKPRGAGLDLDDADSAVIAAVVLDQDIVDVDRRDFPEKRKGCKYACL